jgi:hypothetical protein
VKALVRETDWDSRGLCPSQRSESLPAYEAGEQRWRKGIEIRWREIQEGYSYFSSGQ